jgi:hypothetical protein
MDFWLRCLGILAGALSLMSLAHQHWHFDLAIFTSQVIDFYRALLHPPAALISSVLHQIIPWRIPPDALIIWALIAGAMYRFSFDLFRATFPVSPTVKPYHQAAVVAIASILWPVSFVMLIVDRDFFTLRQWAAEIGKALLAFAAFFALNAGLT